MGFFNLYKPREYKPRFIYHDPDKEEKKEREKKQQIEKERKETGEFKTTIKRGSFREMSQYRNDERKRQTRQSNIRLLVTVSLLLLAIYFLFKLTL